MNANLFKWDDLTINEKTFVADLSRKPLMVWRRHSASIDKLESMGFIEVSQEGEYSWWIKLTDVGRALIASQQPDGGADMPAAGDTLTRSQVFDELEHDYGLPDTEPHRVLEVLDLQAAEIERQGARIKELEAELKLERLRLVNAVWLLSPFADAVGYDADKGKYIITIEANQEPYIEAFHFVDAFRYPPSK